MTSTSYEIKKLKFNDYEAYFLTISRNGLFGKKKTRFVPTLSNFIAGHKNKMTKISRFPGIINEHNFFHFIHAEDKCRLKEFTGKYPDIRLYIDELKKYFKSLEDEQKYQVYANLIIPKK